MHLIPPSKSGRGPGRKLVLLNWPAPRWQQMARALENPGSYQHCDGLSHLPKVGVDAAVLDSSPRWLNPFFARGSMLAGIDPWRFLKQLWHYQKFDVLIGIDSSSVLLFVLLKRLLKLSKPVMVIDPALDASYPRRMILHRAVLPYVQQVVVYGRVQLDVLKEMGVMPSRIHFVPHRMDTEFFDPAKGNVRPELACDIFAVGNDVGRDFETLIKAVEGTAWKVVIHTKRPLKVPLPPNVEVRRNWLSFEDLRDSYASARVVVMPLHDTVHASGVNSLLEALSMGRPVIVSDSRGVRDYGRDGESLVRFPVGSSDELSALLNTLLTNEAACLQLQQGAGSYVREELTFRRYCERLKNISKPDVMEST